MIFSIVYILQNKCLIWCFFVQYGIIFCINYEGGRYMPNTGEKPGRGEYTCDNCGQVVVLDDDTDTMPPCPKCNGTEFH